MRDVKRPLGETGESLLRHMIAKHHAQRLMQDMGRRMVGASPCVVIDLKRPPGLGLQRLTIAVMTITSPSFLRVSVTSAPDRGDDFADVADLAARLAVEQRLVEISFSPLTRSSFSTSTPSLTIANDAFGVSVCPGNCRADALA